ncbi:MAG: hypothetical protein JO308_00795, partial [Verrucomicrobia bacterium]|nr:hypothetical protein [Verrucomicrobiota bacterium]
MPKASKLCPTKRKTRQGRASWCVNVPANLSETGRRQQKFFDRKADASAFCEILKTRQANFGISLFSLSPEHIAEAAEAYKLLNGSAGLIEAVREFLQTRANRALSLSFLDLFNEFLESKKDRNEQYLKELRYARDRFSSLHARLASDLTA